MAQKMSGFVAEHTMSLSDKIVKLQVENRRLRKLGTDLMLAVEDVAEHYDDKNWPDDMGWSKGDLEKQVERFERALKGK